MMLSLYTIVMGAAALLRPIHYSQLEAELQASPAIQASQIEFSDRQYILPSHDWLVSEFIPYTLDYFESQGLMMEGEGMDCDNLSRLFQNLLMISNSSGGGTGNGDVPCAIMKVKQVEAFGGVPGGDSYHSLVLIRTERGWHIIEPQTGEIAAFEHYSNRPHIEWIFF